MDKFHIVIAPSSSALPELYNSLMEAVGTRNIAIEALHLPSVGLKDGARPGPPPTMYDDSAFIQARVAELAESGKSVVLMAHSYSGVPVSQSVEGLSVKERRGKGQEGGIVGLAYVTCLVPELGKAAQDVLPPPEGQPRFPKVMEDGWFYYNDIPKVASTSFSMMPKEKGEYWASKLVKHSAVSFGNPLTYAGYKDVPVSYLLCEEDRSITADIQQKGIDMMEASSGNKVDVTRIKADHVAPLSTKNEVVDWLVKLAEKYGNLQ